MAEKVVEKSGVLERKAIIKNADMTEDMQQDAIECASQVSKFPFFSFLKFPNCITASGFSLLLFLNCTSNLSMRA